jgi:signal transduction histidine kinase
MQDALPQPGDQDRDKPQAEAAGIPADRLVELVEAAAAVAGQTDLSAVLFTTVEMARDLTGARYGALGVIGEHGMLVEFLHSGLEPRIVAQIGAPPRGHGVLGTITRAGKTVRLDDVSSHPDSVGFPEHHPHMEGFLGVPVRVGGEIYGNLYLAGKAAGFTDEDEAIVDALAVIAGSALHTARLQRRLRRVAVVEDRERIARDLHDAIIQDLFAVGLSLQAQSQKIPNAAIQEAIGDTVQRLDEAIAALRRFIFDLRPPMWSSRDIREELPDLLRHLGDAYPAQVRVTFQGDLGVLPPAVVDDCLQIVSEAVSNALRHAETDVIDVTLIRETDELVVIVADQGIGFDPRERSTGMGLDNLRTRAVRAGGEAAISSSPGAGTTIRISLPV